MKFPRINLLAAYPVGAYYWSSDPTSPADLFGGTWERIENRFIYAASTAHPAGSTGGAEAHTLTVSEMPTHGGHVTVNAGSPYYLNISNLTKHGSRGRGWAIHSDNEAIPATETKGGGMPHTNMPPYIAAYCWHRTA